MFTTNFLKAVILHVYNHDDLRVASWVDLHCFTCNYRNSTSKDRDADVLRLLEQACFLMDRHQFDESVPVLNQVVKLIASFTAAKILVLDQSVKKIVNPIPFNPYK